MQAISIITRKRNNGEVELSYEDDAREMYQSEQVQKIARRYHPFELGESLLVAEVEEAALANARGSDNAGGILGNIIHYE